MDVQASQYQGSCTSPRVQFQLGFWQGRPPTVCLSYLGVPHGVGLLNIQGSVSSFFILCIHVQGLLGCLRLVFLICLCVSWVACHPAFIKPGIREVRTTAIWSRTALWGQGMTSVHPLKSSSTPVTQIWHPWVSPTPLHPRGLVLQP